MFYYLLIVHKLEFFGSLICFAMIVVGLSLQENHLIDQLKEVCTVLAVTLILIYTICAMAAVIFFGKIWIYITLFTVVFTQIVPNQFVACIL